MKERLPTTAATDGLRGLPELSALVAIGLQARYRSTKPAITDGETSVTYAELWSRARASARSLAGAGAEAGDRVAFALQTGIDYVAAVLGAQLIGAVAVPLNTRLTSAELAAFLAPVEAAMVVASDEHGRALTAVAGTAEPHRIEVGATAALVAATEKRSAQGSNGAALIVGTGGTTGTPKGALYTHERLWRWVTGAAANNHVRTNDVELFVAPLYHGTLVTGLMTSLSQGATVVMLPRFDAERAVEQIASGRITRMLGAATVVERLVGAARGVDMGRSSLRYLQFGMSSSRSGFATDIRATFPGTNVITGYGATEFGPVTRTYSWEFDHLGDPIGVGHPVAGVDMVIETDGELHGEAGVAGEVLVCSPWQMDCYCVTDPNLEATSRRGRYIRSGDLGAFDPDGNLLLTGRLKDTIRTGGENVYPTEVETALHRHPAVAECAVFGVADTEWGERVEAAVVANGPVSEVQLVDHLRQHVAGYKIPKRIRFVGALPLTSADKVDRRALRQAAERGS